MTLEEIETFLAVAEFKKIVVAAQHLYVSQSTVSHRLQLLEKELGLTLFSRDKGQRFVTLTASGWHFLPIAQQWLTLWRDTKELSEQKKAEILNIGSVDLINNYTLLPLYKDIVDNSKELKLRIFTHHSNEIHNLLENRSIDIGFVFSQVNYPDILSTPVYREKMYLICHQDSTYHDNLELSELPQEQEIYLRWGPDYELWHNYYFSKKKNLVTVNTGSLIIGYLDRPGRWSVVPLSLVAQLKEHHPVKSYTLATPPPPRICYMLTHRYQRPSVEKALMNFRQKLDAFINQNTNICTFEPWMKNTDIF